MLQEKFLSYRVNVLVKFRYSYVPLQGFCLCFEKSWRGNSYINYMDFVIFLMKYISYQKKLKYRNSSYNIQQHISNVQKIYVFFFPEYVCNYKILHGIKNYECKNMIKKYIIFEENSQYNKTIYRIVKNLIRC